MTALEMFNNLDYGVFTFKFPNSVQCFKDYEKAFAFFPDENKIEILVDSITPEELCAINKACEELNMVYTLEDNTEKENKKEAKPVAQPSISNSGTKPTSEDKLNKEETYGNSPEALHKYLAKIAGLCEYVCDNYSKEELIKSLINHMLDK